ncbi:MAG TPA: hypothetical protein VFB21_02795 [Chthonomonadaceae bacterium]|nr:hypothetical protein [Chthonomonadaceae bacterium]
MRLMLPARRGAPEGPRPLFQIGPDREDVRECRPYFVVPLLELVPPDYTAVLRQRILQTAETYKQVDAERPVTDLYILSHGWHRNFFGAVAAYDRLMSRVAVLRNRQRLRHPEGAQYRPLFLTLHWHSDPGEDSWVDKQGRRHKASFLANVRATFLPKPQTPWTGRSPPFSTWMPAA